MNLEKELAQEVLDGITIEKDVNLVDKDFQKYYQYINSAGRTYDIKLFNEVDRKHTKYLLRKLS